MKKSALYIIAILSLSACASTVHRNLAETPATPAGSTQPQIPRPKYGPEILTLLSQSHEFIQKHSAPDYWALSPYYIAQKTDDSCSTAVVTMVVNAARVGQKLTSDDKLATEAGILDRTKDEAWKAATSQGGHGVTLDELKTKLEESLKAYGVNGFSVEAIHAENTPEFARALHKRLVENEKTNHNFIVVNFLQKIFTGDPDGGGHFSPIGAYDQKNKRVLVMDPDREWYEPYWVSEATLLKAMATSDSETGHTRGYLWVQIKH